MRIVHTSDWHLGKSLENVSRLDEQEKFCNDFVKLVEEKRAEIVLIAGDIYDTYNPSAAAENLFYNTIERLSNGGKRYVHIIAGNHDNPERLEAVNPVVANKGITILGYPKSVSRKGKYSNFEIVESKEGFTKIRFGEEIVNIISMPYPSEKRLNEVIEGYADEEDMQKSYSQKIGELFRELESNYRDDEINIAVSHIFVVGSSVSDSERRIELGGSLLVEKKDLPLKSQYTALGHIHKPQRMSKEFNAYYSGSPIQYSKSERNSAKSVYIVDLNVGEEALVTQEFINNYRPIELFKCKGIEEALEIANKKKDSDIFSYFEIVTDKSLETEDIRNLKKTMKNVLEIRPIIESSNEFVKKDIVDINRNNIEKFFMDFFKENKGTEASDDILNIFRELISEDEEL